MNRVVITGIGVVSPVGNDVGTFWKNLTEGRSGIGPITKFDTSDFKAKLAAEVKDFSAADYFSVSEARKADGYMQYAMGAAVQAVADSGICALNGNSGSGAESSPPDGALSSAANVDPERLGVYVGSGIGGMNTFMSEMKKYEDRGPSRVSPFFIPMMIGNMAAGMIAIRFGAQGPTLPVTTACATSANTIGEAFRAIKFGYADAVIAGGAECAINPLAVAGFTNCMALTESSDPARASIPFDRERSGFVMGEGAGIVVLEEYERARKRGAKIYAEVCGYGNTCDAYHVTAPTPDGTGAARALRLAADEAGVSTADPFYINAHGTSTPLNDKTETLAIKLAFGADAYRAAISSTKSMTGHMLGAAGAVEIIACALALRDGIIPPTAGYREKDPDCDLDYVPNAARKCELSWAVSSSLGFGGHNACVALKKAESKQE